MTLSFHLASSRLATAPAILLACCVAATCAHAEGRSSSPASSVPPPARPPVVTIWWGDSTPAAGMAMVLEGALDEDAAEYRLKGELVDMTTGSSSDLFVSLPSRQHDAPSVSRIDDGIYRLSKSSYEHQLLILDPQDKQAADEPRDGGPALAGVLLDSVGEITAHLEFAGDWHMGDRAAGPDVSERSLRWIAEFVAATHFATVGECSSSANLSCGAGKVCSVSSGADGSCSWTCKSDDGQCNPPAAQLTPSVPE